MLDIASVLERMPGGPSEGGLIAQGLLPALSLADLSKFVTRILCYRRGD